MQEDKANRENPVAEFLRLYNLLTGENEKTNEVRV